MKPHCHGLIESQLRSSFPTTIVLLLPHSVEYHMYSRAGNCPVF